MMQQPAIAEYVGGSEEAFVNMMNRRAPGIDGERDSFYESARTA